MEVDRQEASYRQEEEASLVDVACLEEAGAVVVFRQEGPCLLVAGGLEEEEGD